MTAFWEKIGKEAATEEIHRRRGKGGVEGPNGKSSHFWLYILIKISRSSQCGDEAYYS
jgi:hypothetical protein